MRGVTATVIGYMQCVDVSAANENNGIALRLNSSRRMQQISNPYTQDQEEEKSCFFTVFDGNILCGLTAFSTAMTGII